MYLRLTVSCIAMVAALGGRSAIAADLADKDTKPEELKFRPTISAGIGYESNPDSDTDPTGSAFSEDKLGLTLTKTIDDLSIEATFDGKIKKYLGSDAILEWTADAALTAKKEFSKDTSLELEILREQEKDATSNTVNHEAKMTLDHENEAVNLRFRSRLEHEDEVLDEDDTGNEFDYVKPSLEARAILLPKAKVSPFVRAIAGHVSHPNQDGGTVDRNARDYSLIAGLRLTPIDKLTLDVGGRYNERRPTDGNLNAFRSGFVEVSLDWEVSEKFSLEGTISRENKEPEADYSIVKDTTSYELTATFKPTEKWELEATSSYERTEEIGGDELEKDFTLEAKATYSLSSSFDIFAKFEQSWETDVDLADGTKEKIRNTLALLGVAARF